jgi:hypothetical protein
MSIRFSFCGDEVLWLSWGFASNDVAEAKSGLLQSCDGKVTIRQNFVAHERSAGFLAS